MESNDLERCPTIEELMNIDTSKLTPFEEWAMQKARESKEFGPHPSIDDMYRWLDLYHSLALVEN